MNIGKYKKDIEELLINGGLLHIAMVVQQNPEEEQKLKKRYGKKYSDIKKDFIDEYQSWYSEALECVKQLLPSRIDDFIKYYNPSVKRKKITYENYTIYDYLQGLRVTFGGEKVVGPDAAIPKFKQQLKIIESIKKRFESSLFDIHALVQADLFDDELDTAEELVGKGFLRAAGAVTGVVLEGHLSILSNHHKVKISKKKPTISDYNDALKKKGVIEMQTWRYIQFLADIRNLCGHRKKKEPTKEEVLDLIKGVQKIIKTVF